MRKTTVINYIDIGVNLTGTPFRDDAPQVIERAYEAGVTKLIITGTDMSHSEQAVRLCEQWPQQCYATAGIHPHHASDYSPAMFSELADMQKLDCIVAVGECGLDFNRNYSSRSEQIRAFEAQLEVAQQTGKPLFLHQRDAHNDFVAMLMNCRDDLGHIVAHCFTGNVSEAETYVDMGLYIGVTGWICDDRRGGELREAVKSVPLESLMLETDAPYLMPKDLPVEKYGEPIKKGRNEPCFLPHIAETVARYIGVEPGELAEAVYRNTVTFFGIE